MLELRRRSNRTHCPRQVITPKPLRCLPLVVPSHRKNSPRRIVMAVLQRLATAKNRPLLQSPTRLISPEAKPKLLTTRSKRAVCQKEAIRLCQAVALQAVPHPRPNLLAPLQLEHPRLPLARQMQASPLQAKVPPAMATPFHCPICPLAANNCKTCGMPSSAKLTATARTGACTCSRWPQSDSSTCTSSAERGRLLESFTTRLINYCEFAFMH